MRQNVESIQYLRGVAAMMVVFHHAAQALGPIRYGSWVEFGQFGVDVFFVISGFIIYLSVVQSQEGARAFLVKRIIRVVPLYWLFTLLLAAAVLTVPSLFKSTQLTVEGLVRSLLFIPGYNPVFPDRIWPLLVPGWSLNFEMFFYVLMSAAIVFAKGRIFSAVATVIVVCVSAGVVFKTANPLFLTYTHPILIEFLGGMALAVLWLRNAFLQGRWLAWLLPFGFAAFLVHPSMHDPAFGLPPILPAIAVVLGALSLEARGKLPMSPILRALGDASYSIYLSHLFVIGALRPLLAKLVNAAPFWSAAAMFLALAMVASAMGGILVHRSIERPLLKWLRRLSQKTAVREGRQSQALRQTGVSA
jgi:exopolysaccharide production protein ExoZ